MVLNYSYKWDKDKSKLKLIDYLLNEKCIEEIVNFEMKNFSSDQRGVDEANSKLTNILCKMSEYSCKKKKITKRKKITKPRNKWSDHTILELKQQINLLGKYIKVNPYNAEYRIRYFGLLKQLKKVSKYKKAQYKQNLYKQLEGSFISDKQEYWSILKNLKHNETKTEEFEEAIYKDLNPLQNHFINQGNCKTIDKDFQKYIENQMKSNNKNINWNEDTDKPITCKEVKDILNKLKTGKSSGPDKIINEILKYSKDATLKSLTKLFNMVL